MQDMKRLLDKTGKQVQTIMARPKPAVVQREQSLWADRVSHARHAISHFIVDASRLIVEHAFTAARYLHDRPRYVFIPVGGLVASMALVITCSLADLGGAHVAPRPAKKVVPAVSYTNYTSLYRSFAFFKNLSTTQNSAKLPGGAGEAALTLDAHLQETVDSALVKSKAPYAVLVAIEPDTGRILALSSYSATNKNWESKGPFSVFPMASLVKIVTAAAGVENKKCNSNTTLGFCGSLTSESPAGWGRVRGAKAMSVSEGMKKSVNPLFGLLASEVIGKEDLVGTMEKFGFNQPLLQADGVQPSVALHPSTTNGLRLLGCGLDHNLMVSPLHAASIMAAVANGGDIKRPFLVSEIKDAKGQVVYSHAPETLRRVMSPETAHELNRMLIDTVKSGTARHAFHNGRPSPLLGKYTIAAKTGSINGANPKGHYSWFAAYAPADKPRIALAALVINDGKWKIKAPQLGRVALESYLGGSSEGK